MRVSHFKFIAALFLSVAAFAAPCGAQSLRGSKASVRRMYHEARAEGFSFFSSASSVRRAVDAGYLVRLVPDANFTLHDVSYPFARPAALVFVERLGAEYRSACGETLEVTSAVRPSSLRLPNSVARSVHPTGMAVDLHKPAKPACRTWLRETLGELERAGVIEATEEFSPPHFHVAVYPRPYDRYVASLASSSAVRVASAGNADFAHYRVREGDTLWDIAREHATSVDAIERANDLDGSLIQPGDKLLIPVGR
jgi:LysM repeat protein